MTRRAGFDIPNRDPNRPKVPEVAPLIRAYYEKPGNSCGGNCHIVLDDGNLKDDHLRFCLARCEETGDTDGAQIMSMMLQMSPSQRKRLT